MNLKALLESSGFPEKIRDMILAIDSECRADWQERCEHAEEEVRRVKCAHSDMVVRAQGLEDTIRRASHMLDNCDVNDAAILLGEAVEAFGAKEPTP